MEDNLEMKIKEKKNLIEEAVKGEGKTDPIRQEKAIAPQLGFFSP